MERTHTIIWSIVQAPRRCSAPYQNQQCLDSLRGQDETEKLSEAARTEEKTGTRESRSNRFEHWDRSVVIPSVSVRHRRSGSWSCRLSPSKAAVQWEYPESSMIEIVQSDPQTVESKTR